MTTSLNNQKLSFNKNTIKELSSSFIAIDTETTGFSRYNDRLIELGATEFINLVPQRRFQMFIHADKAIPYQVTMVNHITNQMIQDAPFEDEAIMQFINFLGDAFDGKTIVVGHNIKFDLGFLDEALKRIGVVGTFKTVDTMDVARQLLILPNYKQTTVAENFHLNTKGSHRADTDSLICGKMLVKMIELSNK